MSNQNKFNAYKYIAPDYETAVQHLINKGLVLGEPAVIPYYENEATKSARLLFGIGSINGAVEIFNGDMMDTSTGSLSIIYYGAGTEKISVMQNSIRSNTPYMSFQITVTETGSKIYIGFPSSMPNVRFDINGSIEPTTISNIIIGSKSYTLHETIETFDEGTYNVRAINEYIEDSIVITANPNIIDVGIDTIISITAKCSNDANLITIYDASNNILSNGSGKVLTTSYLITPETSETIKFKATADFGGGKILSAQTSVTSVLTIYYGSGQTYEDATSEMHNVTPAGIYNITVNENGDKFFFIIPKNMNGFKIKMNGFDVPMITYNTQDDLYTVYESTNVYTAGNYILCIDVQNPIPPTPETSLIYYGAGQSYADITTYKESEDPKGLYDIYTEQNGDKIFFIIPTYMTTPYIKMSGFEMPTKTYTAVINGIAYTVYESTNQYTAGVFKIEVL